MAECIAVGKKAAEGVEDGCGDLQIRVHLLERALGLREEVVDYTLAKFTLLLVVVHLEDLTHDISLAVFKQQVEFCLPAQKWSSRYYPRIPGSPPIHLRTANKSHQYQSYKAIGRRL